MLISLLLLMVWILVGVPSVHWLDSAELAMSACTVGIGHPPGQVTHAMLGEIFSWLPFGDCSSRISFFSSMSMAAAIFFVTSLAVLKSKLSKWFLFPVALSSLVTTQAVRPEVYALSAALVATTIWLSETGKEDARYRFLSWFAGGFAFVNHPVIALATLPFLFRREFARGVPWMCIAASSLIYLPIRANAGAAWNFGDPHTFGRLMWYLQGKLYKAYDSLTLGQFISNTFEIIEMWQRNLILVGFILAVLGLVNALRKKESFAIRSAVSIFLCLIPLARMTNFWATNPDVNGYLTPSLLIWGVFLNLGSNDLIDAFPNLKKGIYLCLVGWSFFQVYINVRERSLANDWSASRHMQRLLYEPATSASLEVASFETLGLMRYGQVVEGRRADLRISYRGLQEKPKSIFGYPEYWELSLWRDPSGTYGIRPDDEEIAKSLQPTGWFFKKERATLTPNVETYRSSLNAVLNEGGITPTYVREPLILNLALQAYHAKYVHDLDAFEKFNTLGHTMFPEWKSLGPWREAR